jgi:hypothetical protein
MRRWVFENGLSLFFGGLFLVTLVGQRKKLFRGAHIF